MHANDYERLDMTATLTLDRKVFASMANPATTLMGSMKPGSTPQSIGPSFVRMVLDVIDPGNAPGGREGPLPGCKGEMGVREGAAQGGDRRACEDDISQ